VQGWLIFACGGILFWGLFGFTSKLATSEGMDYLTLNFVGSSVLMLTSLTAWAVSARRAPRNRRWSEINLALAGGALSGLGQGAFFGALERGPAALVVPLCALYPAVTVALSFAFLDEKLSGRQKLAIGLTLAAGLVLSTQ